MIIKPYKKHTSISGSRLFLILSLPLVCALIMPRGTSAQVDFAQKYQAYKNTINTATAALNRINYLSVTTSSSMI